MASSGCLSSTSGPPRRPRARACSAFGRRPSSRTRGRCVGGAWRYGRWTPEPGGRSRGCAAVSRNDALRACMLGTRGCLSARLSRRRGAGAGTRHWRRAGSGGVRMVLPPPARLSACRSALFVPGVLADRELVSVTDARAGAAGAPRRRSRSRRSGCSLHSTACRPRAPPRMTIPPPTITTRAIASIAGTK